MPSLTDHLDHDTLILLAGYSTIGSPVETTTANIQAKAEHDAAAIRARINADEA